jgi:transposase-like protein
MNKLRCPQCGLSHVKRNGLTHYGKQNYRRKDFDRQFVEDSQHILQPSTGLAEWWMQSRVRAW